MLNNNRGTSLIEATIVILIISMISIMVFSMLTTAIKVYGRGQENFQSTSEIYSGIEKGNALKEMDATMSITVTHKNNSDSVSIESKGKYKYGESDNDVVLLFEFAVEQ